MRIAIVSTPFVRVPPRGHGGTELFCGQLAEALFSRGHDVTLFATGDSECSGELRSYFREPTWPPSEAVDRAHARFSLHEISRARVAFDAVQVNTATCLPIARDLGIPVVYTLHHARDEKLSRQYLGHPEVHFVAISRRQLELEVPLVRSSVIHHGAAVDDYRLSLKDEGYALHLGRFAPEKGTHHAIDAARQAGLPLVLAGRVHEKDDDARYFQLEVAPRLGSDVVQTGEADQVRKVQLLRGARALLCPIDWEEPFGLIAIEAMLTGTPVIGFARGSFPEIVDEGVTGMLVSGVDEMARAIARARGWDRQRCAARARERFSSHRMARDYERAFVSLAPQHGPYRMTTGKEARLSRFIG